MLHKAKFGEPWFDDNNPRSLSDPTKETWTKEDEIEFNQIRRQKYKVEMYQNAFDLIDSNGIEGDYHEFGCHRARTFRMALIEAKRHFMNMNFYAYDSFQGLPQEEEDLIDASVPQWKSGGLTTNEDEFIKLIKDSNLYNQNIKLFSGFFSEVLPAIDKEKEFGARKASFICIDCDLYTSAIEIYPFIDSLIQEGTIIFVDDYHAGYRSNPNKGVSKAQKEWLKGTDWLLEEYLNVGTFGKTFICYK